MQILDIIVVRTNYEKGYEEWFYGKPDKLRMYGHYDFDFLGTETNNIRLKWMSICFNIDYDNGTMALFLNGYQLTARWDVIGGIRSHDQKCSPLIGPCPPGSGSRWRCRRTLPGRRWWCGWVGTTSTIRRSSGKYTTSTCGTGEGRDISLAAVTVCCVGYYVYLGQVAV